MKISCSLLLTLVGLHVASAQITIDQPDMPSANDTVVISSTLDQWSIDPTLTDTNYFWDFSFLTHTNIKLDTFKAVSSFPFGYQVYFNNQAQYPTHKANFGVRGQDISIPNFISITDVHDFYKVDNGGYKNVGYGATLEGFPISVRNIPIDTVYKFPLNYGDSYTSHSESSLNIPTIGYYGREKDVIAEVDGWGTVQTPYGTFDALRVKLTIDQVDTVYATDFSFGLRIPRPTEIQYHWLTNGQKIPVLQINTSLGLITSIRYKDFPRDVSTEEFAKFEFTLYPNPAQEYITVTLPEHGASFVEIKSMDGKLITQHKNEGGNSVKINTSSLSAGVYLIQVHQNGNTATRKFVVSPN